MPEKIKKIAVGVGIAGILTLLWALIKKAGAGPPPPPPGLANLYGKVTNSLTGDAIPSVLVSLDGAQTNTDSGGNYLFTNVEPKDYVMQFSKEGYTMVSRDITLAEGNNELNIQLVPIAALVANLAGVVKDAETGYFLGGVKVTIDSLITYTDSGGYYSFVNLTPGAYTIVFEKEGYETVIR